MVFHGAVPRGISQENRFVGKGKKYRFHRFRPAGADRSPALVTGSAPASIVIADVGV
jgi:hypothetical protein